MYISMNLFNLNQKQQKSKTSLQNNNKKYSTLNFSSLRDIFTRNPSKISKPLSREGKAEFKLLKRQASRLGIRIERNDTTETLKSKIANAQKDDGLLSQLSGGQPYFSWKLGTEVTHPVDIMFAKAIDNLPFGP